MHALLSVALCMDCCNMLLNGVAAILSILLFGVARWPVLLVLRSKWVPRWKAHLRTSVAHRVSDRITGPSTNQVRNDKLAFFFYNLPAAKKEQTKTVETFYWFASFRCCLNKTAVSNQIKM